MDLKQGIENIVKMQTSPKLRRGLVLQEAWERIAPRSALDHTDNVIDGKKERNSIVIFVDTPHCAANLSMSKEYFRQMMEHETGFEISNIYFVVSKENGIRKEFKKRETERPWYYDSCESVPLNEMELRYARMTVEGIEDEILKETLFNAFVSDMEWKKGIKRNNKPQTEN